MFWNSSPKDKCKVTQHDVYYKICILEDLLKASQLLRDFAFEICENACGSIEIIHVAEFVDHGQRLAYYHNCHSFTAQYSLITLLVLMMFLT